MKIAVVGAGAAGMRTAMLLERQGHDVTIFESNDRLGGRMQTAVLGGQRYEAGGEWIDTDHERCQNLAHELGLVLISDLNTTRRFHYRDLSCTDETLWPAALQDELGFEGAAREQCRNLRRPVWLSADSAMLDQMTLAHFIDAHSTSELGRWYLKARNLSDEGTDAQEIGLLGWLGAYMNYLDRQGGEMSAYRLHGGASALFESMAARLKAEVHLNHKLACVEFDPMRLTFADGAVFGCNAVVLTLPPRALEKVLFDPPLPAEKRCAIEACQMSPILKFALQFDRPWWNEIGWSGEMQTDRLIQQTWPTSESILMAYVCGQAARDLAADLDPVQPVLNSLIELYPEAEEAFVDGQVTNWIEIAGGGFSNTAPGYMTDHMPHIATPVGQIHFAGEHTSPWLGFIEGALESAERVAGEF